MSDRIFQDAYDRVRSSHDDQTWFSLSPREITDSIYREIRALDRQRALGLARDEGKSSSDPST